MLAFIKPFRIRFVNSSFEHNLVYLCTKCLIDVEVDIKAVNPGRISRLASTQQYGRATLIQTWTNLQTIGVYCRFS